MSRAGSKPGRTRPSQPFASVNPVAGPWFHGQWHAPKADAIGLVTFGGHDTALEFRERIEAPWFRYWLHGSGGKFPWKASTFQTGSNTWRTYAAWPPRSTASGPPRLSIASLSSFGSLSTTSW